MDQRNNRPGIHYGRAPGDFFSDGMVVTFDPPCAAIGPADTLVIRTRGGESMEIFPATVRRDGALSVWYAPHPLLRHWLGWMVRQDDAHWTFHMEGLHIDMLSAIPELCESR